MIIQEGGTTVSTLAALNDALAALNDLTAGLAIPLTTASFDQTNNPTAAEIDRAIANSSGQIYEWMDPADAVSDVNAALAPLVANPNGYDLLENTSTFAYVADGGYGLDNQARNLIVSAANKLGKARHQTSDATGVPTGADAYIHLDGPNLLYAYSDDGTHRGIPMVTILGSGNVNAGTHQF